MRKLVLSMILLMFNRTYLVAQQSQFEKDMQMMLTVYSAKSKYSMQYDLEVRFDGVINSSLYVETLVSDTNSFSRIGQNLITIHGPKHSIAINNDAKYISIAERKFMNIAAPTELFTLKDSNYKVTPMACEKSHRCYRLDYSNGELESILIKVDSLSGLVTQVEYTNRNSEEYGSGHQGKRTTIVKVKKFEVRTDIPEYLFVDKTYIRRVKKVLEPLSPYEGYQVFNFNEK